MLRAHGVELTEAGLVLGIGAAIGGWAGITLGGWLSDKYRDRTVNARIYVGLAVPILATPFALGFLLAENAWVAYACSFGFSIFSPMWIGAAASTVNDLVMPRMRALASAYYILMNTFIGLALGPYGIGRLSDGREDLRLSIARLGDGCEKLAGLDRLREDATHPGRSAEVHSEAFELLEPEATGQLGGIAQLEVSIQRQMVGDQRDPVLDQEADALLE